MKANVTITMGSDGYYSCSMEESFPDFALFGYGETAQQAKEDLLESYSEISQMLREEGKEVPELEFEWHYDIQAFFNYFDFLNISKVAEAAGINQSLMRIYAAGIVSPGEGQYKKLYGAIRKMAGELSAAAI